MPTGRLIARKIPVCPGRDSRFTIRRNSAQGNTWWVYYENPTDTFHPADDAHTELVQLVNQLKESEANYEGGAFSINEHSQVIARMTASSAYDRQSIHVIGHVEGTVETYISANHF